MLKNAYLLAKIGADTAENERHFAKMLPRIGNYPTGATPLRDIAFESREESLHGVVRVIRDLALAN